MILDVGTPKAGRTGVLQPFLPWETIRTSPNAEVPSQPGATIYLGPGAKVTQEYMP